MIVYVLFAEDYTGVFSSKEKAMESFNNLVKRYGYWNIHIEEDEFNCTYLNFCCEGARGENINDCYTIIPMGLDEDNSI
jgi:hypothetical protein